VGLKGTFYSKGGKVGRAGLAKSFVGLPGGETNEKGEAVSPIKAARRTALDNKRDYRRTII
jgi:hypothetical protein